MSEVIKSCYLSAILLLLATPVFAQKTIQGTITDASSGESLPSANISIEDTYRGTISNSDGRYTLTIPDSLLPATIMVRYLGFNTEHRTISRESARTQNFTLEPSMLELGEVVVTGEDPAISIMREVIRRKQQWRERLETYRAEAYTRQSISNDTSIVMISESVSEAFWDKEQGHREVLKSKRQTANIEASSNFAGVSYFPNLYDDNIEIAGFELVGVTHPDALKYYHFKLADYRNIDDQVVYQIEVTPARKLQPLFQGTIYVLDQEYALLEVKLKPNDVVDFPQPVKNFNAFYEQQFNNYGQAFWLPADMRIEGDIKIAMVGLEFPQIKFRQISQITNYKVNVPLPDSLYQRDEVFTVDSTSIGTDSLFVKAIKSVPLSSEEEEAYASLDSTATLEKAFKPSGFLARFIDDDEEENGEGDNPGFLSRIPGDISPAARYNRVDQLYLGLRYGIGLTDRLELDLNGGYSTGYEEWGYGGGLEYELIDSDTFDQNIGGSYKAHTATQYQSAVYGGAISSLANLLGEPNYYNYFRNEGFRLFTEFDHHETDLSATIGYNHEEHRALTLQTRYDLLGRNQPFQLNPAIEEGNLRSIDFEIGYNLGEDYNFGVTALNRLGFYIEHSDGSLGSDFDFTRYRADISWSIPTFYQRRFLSNSLDLKLTGGTFGGRLPLQKMGIIDVSATHFSPFGTLKTRQHTPYMGEQYLMLNAEHNFRSVPFEALGLSKLVEWNWGLILFGGAGKTWISDTRKQDIFDRTGYLVPETGNLHLEAGLSLNGLFGLFRVDFAQRLDQPAFMVNVSIARIF
ncbi:DUF5686 and carboxypeptidase regulatory-like domain-containing protein [Aliifodinibius sp. S!AR15-10]|uniref:DUF5686 and carboxypeptidase-like regulatory domain-containing protein n=1 Tax=Aliifodinibius sp. S!AR15-10 TaxID=2950437 RepID=UPI00285664CB|nr:DUF5686 family protein [Aliifodinibius sp. S!AR15-10]MDR8394613.1 DUF5686 and carboxypeptidase regulatory-like domain-containing protein [Aliifodinibius sp. S!AR15-10]